jgi:hypothetical protein
MKVSTWCNIRAGSDDSCFGRTYKPFLYFSVKRKSTFHSSFILVKEINRVNLISSQNRRQGMKRFPFAAVLPGVITAQMLATIHIYASNTALYRTLVALKNAGYRIVPNERILPELQTFWPAFWGGLFFTLSVGAALSILTYVLLHMWVRLFNSGRLFFVVFLIIWAGCFVALNGRGFNFIATAYFMLIPLVTGCVTLRWAPPLPQKRAWPVYLLHLVPILILTGLWTTQLDDNLFTDVRDHLLLSNPLGSRINRFYYRYSLYPAEAVKSLDQKLLKSYHVDPVDNKNIKTALENTLARYDYLPLGSKAESDLKIATQGNALIFFYRNSPVLQTAVPDFLANPGSFLNELSLKTDRNIFFRHCIFFSLLTGLPLLLYVVLFSFLSFILNCFMNRSTAALVAASLCFLCGLTLYLMFHSGRSHKIDRAYLSQALQSESRRERVAALKMILQQRIDIGNFIISNRMLNSDHIPERYRLVLVTGMSSKPETYRILLSFMDDPHPNVVSMAFYALGKRFDRRSIKEILKRIQSSNDWYNQLYAYNALRTLGWKQTVLK